MTPFAKLLPILGIFGAAGSLSVMAVLGKFGPEKELPNDANKDVPIEEGIKFKYTISSGHAKSILSEVASSKNRGELSYGRFPELESELFRRIGQNLSGEGS